MEAAEENEEQAQEVVEEVGEAGPIPIARLEVLFISF
jgi:hypothetical protein